MSRCPCCHYTKSCCICRLLGQIRNGTYNCNKPTIIVIPELVLVIKHLDRLVGELERKVEP